MDRERYLGQQTRVWYNARFGVEPQVQTETQVYDVDYFQALGFDPKEARTFVVNWNQEPAQICDTDAHLDFQRANMARVLRAWQE